jgi:hypothetical protein
VKPVALISAIALIAMSFSGYCTARSQLEKARAQRGDLRLGSYATSRQVEQLATDKADRSWGEYRRALLTELAQSIFVGPAKEVNPTVWFVAFIASRMLCRNCRVEHRVFVSNDLIAPVRQIPPNLDFA